MQACKCRHSTEHAFKPVGHAYGQVKCICLVLFTIHSFTENHDVNATCHLDFASVLLHLLKQMQKFQNSESVIELDHLVLWGQCSESKTKYTENTAGIILLSDKQIIMLKKYPVVQTWCSGMHILVLLLSRKYFCALFLSLSALLSSELWDAQRLSTNFIIISEILELTSTMSGRSSAFGVKHLIESQRERVL